MIAPLDRRLLLLVDESPYEREHAALARRATRAIGLLEARGWDVTAVTIRHEWDWHEQLRSNGRAAHSLRCRFYWQIPLAALRLGLLLRRANIDVIHGSGALAALISGLSRFIQRRPARIYERHHFLGRPRLRVASRLATRWSDHTIACSDAVRRIAIEADRSPPSQVTAIHAAGDPPRQVQDNEVEALRAELGITDSSAVVVMIARLRPEKGHLIFLEAMRLVAGAFSMATHAVLVGAGPYESAIREALRPDEPYELHMVGHQGDIAPWLALADVVAMPSLIEPFGKVAYETLAAGRPLVASRVGGIPETIQDGENGLLVPPNDADALAKALLDVLGSESLRKKLQAAGPKTYRERFTLEKRIADWVECYESVLHRLEQARQAT